MAVVIDELQSTVEPEETRVTGEKSEAQSLPEPQRAEELGADLRHIMKRQMRLRAD
jgi:hypothetical protein